jgi:hypothetical protein
MRAWTFTWVSFVGMAAGTFVYVNAAAKWAMCASLPTCIRPRCWRRWRPGTAALAGKPLLRRAHGAAVMRRPARSLVLFNYDWDRLGFGRWAAEFPHDHAGFDLFSFPSNARLPGFDLTRFVDRLARRAPRAGWQAVTSNHEQFGALAAAMLAERMGWPGTPVHAVLACQHKLHARRVMQQVAPEANTGFGLMPRATASPCPRASPTRLRQAGQGGLLGAGAHRAQPRRTADDDSASAPGNCGSSAIWSSPSSASRCSACPRPAAPTACCWNSPRGLQYNLDGYVFRGELRPLGVVHSEMYPGTQCFRRFVYPCGLPDAARAQAINVARRFLAAIGFDHGLFNMEFFYDAASGKLTVIEFNPRMASQFSDLYLRVDGVDLHRVALELAFGRDPALLPRAAPSAGIAASFVYRSFDPAARPTMPSAARQAELARQFPDAMLFRFPKTAGQIARDFKWLSSYRYGILHLGGADVADLAARCAAASALLGWPAPCTAHDAAALAAHGPDARTFPGDPDMKRFSLACAGAAALLLAGCGAMTAQNPSGKYTPVNAVAEGDDARVMLKGADVVAYFTEGKYRQGTAQFSSRYEDTSFRFASAENKACSTSSRPNTCPSSAAIAPTASPTAFPGAAMPIPGR